MRRRHLLAAPLLSIAPLGAALQAPVQAQEAWPTRPVSMIVPWAPGGSTDVITRLLTPQLEARLGQPFAVENRPGAGGSVGMGAAMRARPDGHAFLISSASNHVFHPLISGGQGQEIRDAFHGIAMWVDVPIVIAVHPSLPVRTVQELIAHLRTQPGGMSFGASGVGSANHLAGELLRMRTSVEMTHVPYRGGAPVLNDLAAGTIQMAFLSLLTAIPPAQEGRIRLIAVCTAERLALRPDLPTVSESGVPDYAVRSWTGLFAPRGTPAHILNRMSGASKEVLEAEQTLARLRELGSEGMWMDAAATDRFVREEYTRWAPIIRAAGVKAD